MSGRLLRPTEQGLGRVHRARTGELERRLNVSQADLRPAPAGDQEFFADTAGNSWGPTGALAAKTTASDNTAVGVDAGALITSGEKNVAVGDTALPSTTTGSYNVAVGLEAGPGSGYGGLESTVCVGNDANVAGHNAVAVGVNSLGGDNDAVAIGNTSLAGLRAVALGKSTNADDADSVALGSDSSTTAPFQVAIDARHIELRELAADPSAPAANSVRLYAKDNGAGKTGLYARFATGAVQQIALEP